MKTTAKSQSKIYLKKLWTVHTVFSLQVPAINQNDKILLTFIKPLEFYSLDFFFPDLFSTDQKQFISNPNTLHKDHVCKGPLDIPFDTPLSPELWCPKWYEVDISIICLLQKQWAYNNRRQSQRDFQICRWTQKQQRGNEL